MISSFKYSLCKIKVFVCEVSHLSVYTCVTAAKHVMSITTFQEVIRQQSGMYQSHVPLSLPPSLPLYLRTLGTPDDTMWQGVTSLPDYKNTFPKWPTRKLQSVIKVDNPEAVNLLEVGFSI